MSPARSRRFRGRPGVPVRPARPARVSRIGREPARCGRRDLAHRRRRRPGRRARHRRVEEADVCVGGFTPTDVGRQRSELPALRQPWSRARGASLRVAEPRRRHGRRRRRARCRRLVASGTPHLVVTCQERIGRVGPLVVPGALRRVAAASTSPIATATPDGHRCGAAARHPQRSRRRRRPRRHDGRTWPRRTSSSG